MEQEMQELKKKIDRYNILGELAVLIIAIIIACLFPPFLLLILPPGIIILFLIINYYGKKITRFFFKDQIADVTTAYINEQTDKYLREILSDATLIQNEGMTKEEIIESGVVMPGDKYYSNDYIRGKYKDTVINQADVEVFIRMLDNYGREHDSASFSGRVLSFDLVKPVDTKIYIRKKELLSEIPGTTELITGIEGFDKEYKVLAVDEKIASNYITNDILGKIKNLTNKGYNTMTFCFNKDKLYIGVNGKTFYEPNMMNDLEPEVIKIRIKESIQLIADIIDTLNTGDKLIK